MSLAPKPQKTKNQARRQFLQTGTRALQLGLLTAAIPSLASRALASTGPSFYAEPDLVEANILRFVAGIRPHRTAGLRVELESRFGKMMIHNYGHSGAGFTLAWGSSASACALIPSSTLRGSRIAVLGAGIVGLATAHELRSRGYHVTIYAEKFFPNVTSAVAGGQWSPALIRRGTTPDEQAWFNSLLEYSFVKYREFAGSRYGVTMRDNIIVDGSHDPLQDISFPSMPPHQRVDQLPFPRLTIGGTVQPSWLIDPPTFMPRLTQKLLDMHVVFKEQTFAMDDAAGTSCAAVSALPESLVFNCMGLGAGRLLVDPTLVPIRGRLIHLYPDPDLDYLLLMKGYMFPRGDAVVLGGSFDKGHTDLPMDLAAYETIFGYHRDFFGVLLTPLEGQNIPYVAVSG